MAQQVKGVLLRQEVLSHVLSMELLTSTQNRITLALKLTKLSLAVSCRSEQLDANTSKHQFIVEGLELNQDGCP
eukprot:169226-Amphidinium_carterae.1